MSRLSSFAPVILALGVWLSENTVKRSMTVLSVLLVVFIPDMILKFGGQRGLLFRIWPWSFGVGALVFVIWGVLLLEELLSHTTRSRGAVCGISLSLVAVAAAGIVAVTGLRRMSAREAECGARQFIEEGLPNAHFLCGKEARNAFEQALESRRFRLVGLVRALPTWAEYEFVAQDEDGAHAYVIRLERVPGTGNFSEISVFPAEGWYAEAAGLTGKE